MLPCAPKQRHGACVDTAGVESNTGNDRIAACRRLHARPWRAHALVAGRTVSEDDLSETGMQGDEHRVAAQADRVAHFVSAEWQIDDTVTIDCALQSRGVIRLPIADYTEVMSVGPL